MPPRPFLKTERSGDPFGYERASRGTPTFLWVIVVADLIIGAVLISGGFAGADGNNHRGERALELLASATIVIGGEGELPHDAGKVSGTYGRY